MLNIKLSVNNVFGINEQLKADKRLQITNRATGQIKGYLALCAIIKSKGGLMRTEKNHATKGIHYCLKCKKWFYNRRAHELCPDCTKIKRVYYSILYLLKQEKILKLQYQDSPEKLKKLQQEKKVREQFKLQTKGNKKEYQRLLCNYNMNNFYHRHEADLQYKLSARMSQLIYYSLKQNKAGKHWEDLMNFNLEELKKHLDKTMPQGYTWKDFQNGNKLHIDHIIPKCVFVFDFPEDKEFKMCWSLYNLRLLPMMKNVRKNNNFDNPILLWLLIKELSGKS